MLCITYRLQINWPNNDVINQFINIKAFEFTKRRVFTRKILKKIPEKTITGARKSLKCKHIANKISIKIRCKTNKEKKKIVDVCE